MKCLVIASARGFARDAEPFRRAQTNRNTAVRATSSHAAVSARPVR